jgi:hypothetical protein
MESAMNKVTNSALALLAMVLVLATPPLSFAQSPSQAEFEGESVLVGRISHVEGWVLRYIPEEREWERTIKDAPFGLEDKLRTDKGARAEIILPNNTWARMDELSQAELVSLKNDETVMHMVYGAARFYNRGSDSKITVTTPFGYVTSPGKTSFDLYVSDTSLEVISWKGSVFFSREDDRSRHEVMAGSSSLVADGHRVGAGMGSRDAQWDAWNDERDNLWARRMRAGGPSAKYLPPVLDDQAYVLEDYGVWERVYHDGHYGYFWRPVHVGVGWAPFTVGRWAVWYGDHVWIPGEPFGYVTHHYGNWVYVGRYWYWAPPVVAVGAHFSHPGLSIRFGWYPGRVAWIHFGVNVGWVPLAPHEPYYCHRHWGPRTIVVKDVHVTNIHVGRYVNIDRTVVVKNQDFYRVGSYNDHRVRNVDQKTIVNQYRAAPVIDQKIVPEKGRERYSFSPVRTEGRQESVSKGGGPDRPSAAKEERVRSQATAGGGPTPSRMEKQAPLQGGQTGKPQVQQKKGEDKARSDAVKREGVSSERRSTDEPGASGRKRDRSSPAEIQRPSSGPTEDRMKSGGAEREIPQRGKPDREHKGTVKEDSSGNAPKNETSSPEKAEQQSRTAPTEDKRGRPSRAPNQDRQTEPEKKEQQQRGARGRE